MNTVLVTPPAGLPVSLAEVKNLLKIEDSVTEDDALTMALLRGAVEYAEMYQGRRFITQTWDLILDDFPCGVIEIPYGTLQSVTSISYYDTANVLQTWSASNYQVDTGSVIGNVSTVYGVTYPSTYERYDAVKVRFVCGYGTDPADVPETTRLGVLLLIKEWYDKRGQDVNLDAAEMLLYPQRIAWL